MLLESCLALFPVTLLILEVKEGGILGRLPFKTPSIQEKFRFEFRKFHVPIGTVNSRCRDTTQATEHLIKRDTEDRYRGQQFVK